MRKVLRHGMATSACAMVAAAAMGISAPGAASASSVAPIVVGQIVPASGQSAVDRDRALATLAMVEELNRGGGIEGHRIKLIQCNSEGDPGREAACAHTIVASRAVATLSDSVVGAPATVQSILSAAGIPRLGVEEASIAEYQAPGNFPVDDGGILQLVAMLDVLVRHRDTKISVVLPEADAASGAGALLAPAARLRGATIVDYVYVPPSAADFGPYVVQAGGNGAQAALVDLGAAQLSQLAATVERLRPKLAFSASSTGWSAGQLHQLGAFARHAYLLSPYPVGDDVRDFPGLRTVMAQLRAGGLTETGSTMTQAALSSWLAAEAFAEILDGAKRLPATRAQVMAAVRAAKEVPMGGIVRPWSPGAARPAGLFAGLFTNVSNPYEYQIAYNGRSTSTSISRSFDVLATLGGSG